MPARNIELTDDLDRFVEDGVSSGRFGTASEAVQEALRLLEERGREEQAKLKWLSNAAKVAFDSIDRGEGLEFESIDDLDDYIDRMRTAVSAELAAESKLG